MDDFDAQLHHWRELERLASDAEARLKKTQAANTPEFHALAQEAAHLRKQADDFLYDVLGQVYKESRARKGGSEPPGR